MRMTAKEIFTLIAVVAIGVFLGMRAEKFADGFFNKTDADRHYFLVFPAKNGAALYQEKFPWEISIDMTTGKFLHIAGHNVKDGEATK